jgi:hypothetical protein
MLRGNPVPHSSKKEAQSSLLGASSALSAATARRLPPAVRRRSSTRISVSGRLRDYGQSHVLKVHNLPRMAAARRPARAGLNRRLALLVLGSVLVLGALALSRWEAAWTTGLAKTTAQVRCGGCGPRRLPSAAVAWRSGCLSPTCHAPPPYCAGYSAGLGFPRAGGQHQQQWRQQWGRQRGLHSRTPAAAFED